MMSTVLVILWNVIFFSNCVNWNTESQIMIIILVKKLKLRKKFIELFYFHTDRYAHRQKRSFSLCTNNVTKNKNNWFRSTKNECVSIGLLQFSAFSHSNYPYPGISWLTVLCTLLLIFLFRKYVHLRHLLWRYRDAVNGDLSLYPFRL